MKGTTVAGDEVKRVSCVEVVAWRISDDESAPEPVTAEGPGVMPHTERTECSAAMRDQGDEGMCGVAAIAALTI
jgi:hypothetical protein